MDEPKFSYSKLSTALECPYKYDKIYNHKIKQTHNPKMCLGLTFADISEYVYKNLVPCNPLSDEDYQNLIDKFWIPLQLKKHYIEGTPTHSFIGYKTVRSEITAKRDLLSYIKRYFADFGFQKHFGVELPFQVPYKGIILQGKIDLIKSTDRGLHIRDCKLGNTEYSLRDSLQLGIYTYAIENLIPRYKICDVGYYYVKTGYPATLPRSALDDISIFKEVDKGIAIANQSCFEKQPNKWCKWCQFYEECRN